ncbi:hypothetical protein H3Z85_08665 [Chryseobacterium indologenes]|uniref:Uncharacterized protein n=4 Tax=Chryseobacterium group TaxID=2782232 RepID=A0AAD0YY71_CHRID|nr:hypothetical protein [Chryseobacterium indologenes]GAE63702.1 hypothetical protein CIN01S_04_03090 [Chryseobacterium indologenes NBRC 14944]ASE63477.1 hypothetical protein CEQ15_19330 [Chryseobacterium indologenes]AYZ37608.1 hypothetical protein EGY07_19705 [Chryseobacterium indologenes]AZB19191.1 hypothetical protein EG352_16120 [Chryseobacterium indologenes]QPQ53386.1 hypothetical protein H3Z85_08665 [Chryseobacterium indologenes]
MLVTNHGVIDFYISALIINFNSSIINIVMLIMFFIFDKYSLNLDQFKKNMDKIQTIKERIFIFLENRGIKKETFYKETGMSSSNFKGAGLKSDLGVDKLAKIVNVYPELKDNENLNWLITGHGKLNLDSDSQKEQQRMDVYREEEHEKLGDLLANLFAQYNTQDKGILFIQSQLSRMEKKYDEAIIKQNKYLEEILSLTKTAVK